MNKNQNGFSVLHIFLITVIVGLIGLVGWFVWQTNRGLNQRGDMGQDQVQVVTEDEKVSVELSVAQSNSTSSSDQIVELAPPEDNEPAGTLTARGVTVKSSIPDGWATTKCVEYAKIILPPTKPGVRCQSEDYGFISLMIVDGSSVNAPQNCDNESSKREEYSKYDWYVSYSCEEITVDGVSGVRESTEENEYAQFGGAGTSVTYTFRAPSGAAVQVSLTNAKDIGRPEYTQILDEYVRTLQFN